MKNMSLPLISVIIPIYKVEDYLRECVDSVLNQTYQNLEVILVDDGSPDRCGVICDEYAAKDTRITVIHKENGGLSDARNAGLDIAKGEYISFVDSDDFVHPQFIETLYTALTENNADVSFCDFLRFRDGEKIVINPTTDDKKTVVLSSEEMVNTLYNSDWVPKNIVVWNKLYKRTIFTSLRFPKGLNHEDEYIFLDVYTNIKKVVFVDSALLFYRTRDESIMGNKYSDKNVESFKMITKNRIQNSHFKNTLKEQTIHNYKTYLILAVLHNSRIAKNEIKQRKWFLSLLFHKTVFWKTRILFLYKYLK